MRMRIASDVGGTFTDSIAYDPASRRISVSKVPTTPQARELGTVDSLRRTLEAAGRRRQRGRLRRPRHDDGHQRRHPAHRRQDRLRHQPRLPRPAADRAAGPAEPVRHRRRAHAAAGAARAVLRHRRAHGRARARDRAARHRGRWSRPRPTCAPRAWRRWRSCSCTPTPIPRTSAPPRRCWSGTCPASTVCISTDILREFREFERASTTVLNAFLTPVMTRYLGSLSARLRDARDRARRRPRQADHGDGGVGRADDGGVGARQAGAHRAVGAGGRRRRRRALRRADRRRQHHHHGYRRHQHRHQPDPQRPAGDDAAAPRSARSRSGCR